MAYVPLARMPTFKNYRGGRTTAIWVVDLASSSVAFQIPRNGSNDFNPMWVGKSVYFLSDRKGPISLFRYDLATRQVIQLIRNEGLDIKSADAIPGTVVYEQFGGLHEFDMATGKTAKLAVRLAGEIRSVLGS